MRSPRAFMPSSLWPSAPRGVGALGRLNDGPHVVDQIPAATLTFSDGSTVTVPGLANAGTAVTILFFTRSMTSIRLTVTTVSSTTRNVALAEFELR
jgi:hypothetical protein